MLATRQRLGVIPSFSRPAVSNDNACSEALCRTLPYPPAAPDGPFASLDDARAWVARCVPWYNGEHLQSGIPFVTPEHRHRDEEMNCCAAAARSTRRRRPAIQPAGPATSETGRRWVRSHSTLESLLARRASLKIPDTTDATTCLTPPAPKIRDTIHQARYWSGSGKSTPHRRRRGVGGKQIALLGGTRGCLSDPRCWPR